MHGWPTSFLLCILGLGMALGAQDGGGHRGANNPVPTLLEASPSPSSSPSNSGSDGGGDAVGLVGLPARRIDIIDDHRPMQAIASVPIGTAKIANRVGVASQYQYPTSPSSEQTLSPRPQLAAFTDSPSIVVESPQTQHRVVLQRNAQRSISPTKRPNGLPPLPTNATPTATGNGPNAGMDHRTRLLAVGHCSNQVIRNLVLVSAKVAELHDLNVALPYILPVLNGFFRHLNMDRSEWAQYGVPHSRLMCSLDGGPHTGVFGPNPSAYHHALSSDNTNASSTSNTSSASSIGGRTVSSNEPFIIEYGLDSFKWAARLFDDACWPLKQQLGNRPSVIYSRCTFSSSSLSQLMDELPRSAFMHASKASTANNGGNNNSNSGEGMILAMPFGMCDIHLGTTKIQHPDSKAIVHEWHELGLKCWYDADQSTYLMVTVQLDSPDGHWWTVDSSAASPHGSSSTGRWTTGQRHFSFLVPNGGTSYAN
jgi:hypothetical protein